MVTGLRQGMSSENDRIKRVDIYKCKCFPFKEIVNPF